MLDIKCDQPDLKSWDLSPCSIVSNRMTNGDVRKLYSWHNLCLQKGT